MRSRFSLPLPRGPARSRQHEVLRPLARRTAVPKPPEMARALATRGYSLDSPLRDRESGRGAGLLAEGEGPGSSLSQGHLLETAGVEVAGLKVGS